MRLRQGLAYLSSLLAIVAVVALLPQCGSQYALLLSIQAKKANYLVEVFDLRVKNIATGEIVLERIGEKVDPADPNRDISEAGKELKIAVEFAAEGNYLVYFLGRSGAGTEGGQFALRDYQVDEVREETLRLSLLVGDKDGDGYPACGPPAGITCPPTNCTYLDCDDNDNTIHPFATEICQDKKDNDCSAGCNAAAGKGDAPCVDNDGDKVPAGPDCDDNDPCKSPYIKEARNLCKTADADWNTQWTQACKDKLSKEGKPYTPPFCGDGIDQDCDGSDSACFVDKDCDEFTPPTDDCDDADPKINKGATEICGDNKDNNCNKVVDEGCRPCDIDGDQFAPTNYKGSDCPKLPRKDTDDYDAGVHPDTTKDSAGVEGGTVLGALREYCSYDKEKNGVKRHRDVDHDGDGQPASADGCPAENCDKDGDGFKGSQCSPPKSQEDCDDTDAQVFPGAPELCGDGKAQNCVADISCTCDTDGDKYCGKDDCNPSDGTIHPWALEKCDKKDNDCDLLFDEGNPDAAGVAIRTDIKQCNDDNDGECAPPSNKLSGICACSPVDTTKIYKHDPANNRTICTGENLTAAASPRCFEALQPQLETCKKEDRNCDGLEFKAGENFLTKGVACGIGTGECKVGTVTDCDLTQSPPNLSLRQQRIPNYNQYWVCSSATVFPVPEACDGKDDDCNGSNDFREGGVITEVDLDQDKHLRCQGCHSGSDRTALSSSYNWCGDCNDSAPTIYVNATENCNAIDDNCINGLADDGKDQCTGSWSCCTSQKSCRQLGSDYQNCGTCGKVCPSTTTDTCSGSKCVCGSASGPCTNDLNCSGGSCKCIQNGLCKGCCDGNTCQPGNTVAKCGDNGVSCKTCSTSDPCKYPVCTSAGNCTVANRANGTGCPGGVCYAGACCLGCWTGSSCQPGNTTSNCGNLGENCDSCTTSNPCKTPVCNSSANCATTDKSNTTACPGGKCYGGNCCTGCWTGSSCEAGNTTTYCGDNGNTCSGCSTANPCLTAVCSGGSCTTTTKAPGTACPGGRCYLGSCCTTCWTGSSCAASITDSTCGSAGGNCSNCSASNLDCQSGSCACISNGNCSGCCSGPTTCQTSTSATQCGSNGSGCSVCGNTAGDCKYPTCPSGTCVDANVTDGTGCTEGGTGTCAAGVCCHGCRTGSSCYGGTADNACGDAGSPCVDCGGNTCRSGSCCSGCWTGSSCVGGTSTTACGDNGDSCASCNSAVGECQVDVCSGGSCSVNNVADATACSSGTGKCYGGSCCTGCWDGSTCEPGTSDKKECGIGGVNCQDCGSLSCSGGTCS